METEKFKKTVIPLRGKLLNHAERILNDEAEAEDSVQETFLRLWNIRAQLIEHPNITGLSIQILKNICIDKIRRKKNDAGIDTINLEANTANPYSYTELNDKIQIIRQIINSLPELQKAIINMRDVEGYELNEIAEITGSNITAIRVNLSRARKKVREQFLNIK